MLLLRQPWNVFVYLFRKNNHNTEYLLLKRKDDGIWQGVAGGGEENENPETAARRETFEETGLKHFSRLFKLDTMSYMEANIFKDYKQWGEDIYVIPMHYFAALANEEIRISGEHSKYGWFTYEEAQNKLYWHDNKTALWELKEKLDRGKLI